MALYNLARVVTATTGTGTVTLGSAVSGFLSFADAGVQNGDVVSYAIKDGTASEIGTGTYSSSGPTLTRTVINSTNSNNAINLSGSAEVFITPNAADFYNVDTLDAITDPASDDTVPVYDTSASAHKKITAANLLKVITDLTAETAPASDDELALYDSSGSATDKITLANLLTVINALTEDTAPVAGDFLVSYDTSATAAKKVNVNKIGTGKQTVWIPAGAMIPRTTNGAASGTTELATNDIMLSTLDFDQTTEEGAGFWILMPKGWNEGTVSFKAAWTTAGGTGGVVWGLAARAYSDDDAIDQALGTQQTVSDTRIANNDMHITSESSAITIAGTPAEGDAVYFELTREVGNGSDTLTSDAKLIGIHLYLTINANTDA